MAAQKTQKPKSTERGMGAVRVTRRPPASSAVDVPSRREPAGDDHRPSSSRDTLPAPPSGRVAANESGARRATTLGLAPAVLPAPPSLPAAPPSASPPPDRVGRYSARSLHDEIILPPSSRPKATPPSSDPPPRAARKSVRVDDVGSTSIVTTPDATVPAKSRAVKRTRPAPADLDTSEAFVHALLGAPLTVEELVDITGMPEREVVRIVKRLIHTGIAAYCP